MRGVFGQRYPCVAGVVRDQFMVKIKEARCRLNIDVAAPSISFLLLVPPTAVSERAY